MVENNNVYKTIWKNGNKKYNEKYICCFFTIWNLKRAIMCKCGRAVLSHTSAYFAISKPILFFSYSFHIPSIILSNVYFYIVRSMFPFLFNRSQSTASIVNHLSHSFFWNSKILFCSFQIFEKGHIQNVISTLINETLIRRCPTLSNLAKMLRQRWNVCWALKNVAKRLHIFVKVIKLKTYILSIIPLNCCFRKLSKRYG